MSRRRCLSERDLEDARAHLLRHGGILFRRMCPRTSCHSVVARVEQRAVCLTCGWLHSAGVWGNRHCRISAQQAVAGSAAGFRGLVIWADPQRWSRLIHRARRRGDLETARRIAERTEALERLAERLHAARPPGSTHDRADDGSSHAARRSTDRQLNHMPQLDADACEAIVFTDGGCDPNPGPGGWAAILWLPGWETEIAGRQRHATNNRMELLAALTALDALPHPCRVTVVSDSAYLVSGMTAWITGWSRRAWRRGGKLIPNTDLWESLARSALRHETYWTRIKGHAGQPENERCDRLAAGMSRREATPENDAVHYRRRPRRGRLPRMKRTATARIWLPERD